MQEAENGPSGLRQRVAGGPGGILSTQRESRNRVRGLGWGRSEAQRRGASRGYERGAGYRDQQRAPNNGPMGLGLHKQSTRKLHRTARVHITSVTPADSFSGHAAMDSHHSGQIHAITTVAVPTYKEGGQIAPTGHQPQLEAE